MARISKEAKAKVRVRLLHSAAAHFAEHGLAGANINQISVDAGFAKGTVYNYFPSKEALFIEVITAGSQQTVDQYRARPEPCGLRAQLVAIVEEDVRLVHAHQAFTRAFVREWSAPSPELRPAVQHAVAPLHELVTEIIEAGQQQHPCLSASRLAAMFLAQLTALYVLHWNSDGVFPTWEVLPELAVGLFLDGASPP